MDGPFVAVLFCAFLTPLRTVPGGFTSVPSDYGGEASMGVKRVCGGGYGVEPRDGTDKFCQIYSTLYPIRRITRP